MLDGSSSRRDKHFGLKDRVLPLIILNVLFLMASLLKFRQKSPVAASFPFC